MLKAYFKTPSRYILILVLFLLADLWLLLSDIGNTKYVYFFITLILGLRLLCHYFPLKILSANGLIAGWIAIMSLNYINDIITPRYPYYFDQRAIVKRHFSDLSQDAIVYSGDGMTAEMGDFFLEFKNKNIKFVNINGSENFDSNMTRKYLLINGGYNPLFKQNADSILLVNDYRLSVDSLQKENTSILYEIKDTTILRALKKFSTNKF